MAGAENGGRPRVQLDRHDQNVVRHADAGDPATFRYVLVPLRWPRSARRWRKPPVAPTCPAPKTSIGSSRAEMPPPPYAPIAPSKYGCHEQLGATKRACGGVQQAPLGPGAHKQHRRSARPYFPRRGVDATDAYGLRPRSAVILRHARRSERIAKGSFGPFAFLRSHGGGNGGNHFDPKPSGDHQG
jgi:hypothetical protein